jgi:hypothetical protein
MRCEEVKEKIILWREIEKGEREILMEHINKCPSCREFLEGERELTEIFKRWEPEVITEGFFLKKYAASLVLSLMAILLFFSLNLGSSPNKTKEFLEGREVWLIPGFEGVEVVSFNSLPEEIISTLPMEGKEKVVIWTYFIETPSFTISEVRNHEKG